MGYLMLGGPKQVYLRPQTAKIYLKVTKIVIMCRFIFLTATKRMAYVDRFPSTEPAT